MAAVIQPNSNQEQKKKKKNKLSKLLGFVKPGKKTTSQDEEIERSSAGGGDDTVEAPKKKGGTLKKFFARGLEKIGRSDKMEIEPTFKESLDLHAKYREDLTKMDQALRLMVEPERAPATRGEAGAPPLESLAAALLSFNTCDDLKPLGPCKISEKLYTAVTQLATVDREGRMNLDSTLGSIDSFCRKSCIYQKHLEVAGQQLEQMNYWRELVKKSSTTQEAKAAGSSYEAACKKFDQSCAYIETEINGTVRATASHQQSFVDFCDKRAHYHARMADLLQKLDNEISPLVANAGKGGEKLDGDEKKGKDKNKKV